MCHPFCTFVWILGGMLLKNFQSFSINIFLYDIATWIAYESQDAYYFQWGPILIWNYIKLYKYLNFEQNVGSYLKYHNTTYDTVYTSFIKMLSHVISFEYR